MSLALLPLAAAAQAPTNVTSLDIVLVIDESGSMWERNDPPIKAEDGSVKNPGWRIVAANLLAEWLGTDQSGARHQMSVILFGTDGQVVYPLQDIHSQDAQTAFQTALTQGHTYLGATDILEALRLAKDELDKGRKDPNVKKAVIFLSDGVCEPKPITTQPMRVQCEQDIRDLVQREFVQNAQYPIYTIALTSDAFKQDAANKVYKNLWQEISAATGGDYYEPAKAEGDLLAAFVSILQKLFGLPMQNLPAPIEAPTQQTFEIPDDLMQVGFTTIKYEPKITMQVFRPDGSQVQAGDPGVQYLQSALTESYNVSRPPGGMWTVKLNGRGKVILLTVPYPKTTFVIERQSPAAAHPQGKPMNVAVRVLDVDQTAKTAQELQLEVVLPDGTTAPVPLTLNQQTYAGVLENTSQSGTYQLKFSGKLDNNAISDQQNIRVVTAPWLKIVAPQPGATYPSNLPVPVQAQLMLGGQPVSQLNPADQLEATVRLVRDNGQIADTQFLRLSPSGIFSGTVLAPGDGDYRARVQLAYAPATGERFEDVSEISVKVSGIAAPTVVPTATPVPIPPKPPEPPSPALIGGIVGAVILALIGLGIVMWRRSKPGLVGSMDVGGVPFALRGKGRLTIGADPRNRVIVQGLGVLSRHAELKPVGNPKRPHIVIRSLDPKNPVMINGLEVTSQTLENGDTLRIGDQSITYIGPERFDDLSHLGGDDNSSNWKF